MSGLSRDRPPGGRGRVADAFYDCIRRRLAAEPVECPWRIALLRIRRV